MTPRALSYGRLIRLPNLFALLTATALARLAGRMFTLAIVFHTLAAWNSPILAGWMSFAALMPGLLVSPLAGAFLDRAGAVRGIVIDFASGALLMLALAAAIETDRASPAVLLLLTGATSLTSPLGAAGIRALLPRLVPAEGLDKANAIDTAIFAVIDIAGPPIGGAMVGLAGAVPTFGLSAVLWAAATVFAMRVDIRPPAGSITTGFLRHAWDGLVLGLRLKLLRGLAIGYGCDLIAWGILIVAVPVELSRHFPPGAWQSIAGLYWAGMGAAGAVGALAAGWLRIRGREVRVMSLCMLASAIMLWPIAAFGLTGLALGLTGVGLLSGPIDVGLLTLRQRRTDPGQLGRVMAISMSLNIAGFPLGNVIGGLLADWSPRAALPAAALAALLGAVLTRWLIPPEER